MKVIIAGSRSVRDLRDVDDGITAALLFAGINPTLILSGCAPGIDKLGEEWAEQHGVAVEQHPAHWARWPRLAGRIRNVEMGRRADALIAIYDGESTGTAHMIGVMKGLDKPYYVHLVDVKKAPAGA